MPTFKKIYIYIILFAFCYQHFIKGNLQIDILSTPPSILAWFIYHDVMQMGSEAGPNLCDVIYEWSLTRLDVCVDNFWSPHPRADDKELFYKGSHQALEHCSVARVGIGRKDLQVIVLVNNWKQKQDWLKFGFITTTAWWQGASNMFMVGALLGVFYRWFTKCC